MMTRQRQPLVLFALLAAACADPDASAQGARIAVSTAPLALAGVGDVVWKITVTTNGGATTVWSETIRSTDTGDGRGSATWIGPCDADAGTNRVTLDLIEIDGTDMQPLGDYVDPTPLFKDVICRPNQDVAVEFDVVVARDAHQGFFDIGVDFEDVFCSAKLDCRDDDGEALKLLFDGATRGPTVVVAFACTAGANETSYLHMDDLVFACSDGTELAHHPDAGPGNVGDGGSPYLFQRGVYRTRELLAPYAKCGWSNAFGLDLPALAAAGIDCTLSGKATVSPDAWPSGFSPPAATWPYVEWNVKVIDDGQLACGQQALDVTDSGVETRYTEPVEGPAHFGYSMACTPDLPITDNGVGCTDPIAGTGPAAFQETPAGVVVRIGEHVTPVALPLPAGATLAGCCFDPCCGGD